MASLMVDLLRGSAALAAQSEGIQITGNNINNVNTAGYSQENVEISEGPTTQGLDGTVTGEVSVEGATQARSTYLDQQVVSETALTSAATTSQSFLSEAQTALGQNIDTSGQASGVDSTTSTPVGINGALSSFFNDFSALAATPTDPTAQASVYEQATDLANQINQASQNLTGVQSDISSQITSDVSSANTLLGTVANLNQQIEVAEENAPGSALSLRDQRQQALQQLAGYMNFQTTADPSGNGAIDLTVQGASGSPVTLVNSAGLQSPVSFNGTNFQAGSPATNLALTSGSLPSELSTSTGAIQTVQNNLSSLASQLITSVNAAYNPSGTGSNFFAAGTGGNLLQVASGITASTVTATATPGSGNNELATAVAALANQSFSTANGDQINGTLGGFFTGTVSNLGDQLSNATNTVSDQQLTLQQATSQQDQVSGVSLDEQTSNLLLFQNAYQAAAQYMNTVNSMLSTVINGTSDTPF
jgi:flagellar hook-associated protein 1 FlgK